MNLSELNSLDFENVGNWPLVAKITAIVFCCIMIVIGGYWLDTSNMLDRLEAARTKEHDLKQLFELKQKKAANLESYKHQMMEIEQTFGSLLKQLPSKTEVADLLTDISQAGLGAGLEFELFKPQAEVPVEFYVELPIKLKVRGRYHEFGEFISAVAALPRIVTLHEFKIVPVEQADSEELIMEATAKTYRYLEIREKQK